MKKLIWLLILIAIAALGYRLLSNTEAPVGSNSDDTVVAGNVLVDDIEIVILESFPVQVRAMISGNTGDACTSIDDVVVNRVGNEFVIDISAKRPEDAICAQVLTPFEENVSLDVYGLPKGMYVVTANGVQETFELQIDNILEEAE